VTGHDLEAFARLMAVLVEVFDKELSLQRVEIYFRALTAYPIERVEATVEEAVRTLKFFPRPADLIELMEGSPDDRAEHAFGQFWLAVTRCGTYRSLYCEDEVLAEVIRRQFGSWADAGHIPRPEYDPPGHQILRKNFLSTYRDLARQRQRWEPYLTGRTEATNLETMPTWTRGIPAEPLVTYLPVHGDPEPRPLRALSPHHPLIALIDKLTQPALPAGAAQDDGPASEPEPPPEGGDENNGGHP
jgi:hypothetical protein